MTTKKADPRVLIQGMAEVEEIDRQLAELRAKTWKKSEIVRLRDHFTDSDRYGAKALQELLAEIQRAEAEGRVEDDLSPTLANLEARNPGAWIVSRVEIHWSAAYARWLSRNPQPDTSYAAERRIDGALSWLDPSKALSTWVRALAEHGRVATAGPETLGGLVYRAAAPAWLGDEHVTVPRGAESPEDVELIKAQADRFALLELGYQLVIERYRLWPMPLTVGKVDPQVVVDLAGRPGFHWFGHGSREHAIANLAAYRRENTLAKRDLEAAWTTVRREGRAAFDELVRTETDAGRLILTKR